MSRPDFIIIGAMKCGTTTLHEQLALQPGIFMSELKEPNFFSDRPQYEQGIDWYLSHFEPAHPDDLCGESSTHYTKLPTYPQTVERLHQHLPQVKLIYVMRHPIERLVSQYIHEWTQRVISIDINRAIYEHPELIEYSQYAQQLQPYFATFGQERILPVFLERLIKNPQPEFERITRFIGYQPPPSWEDLPAQNNSAERVRKSAWRDLLVEAPVLRSLRRQFVPKSFRTWVRQLWALKKKPELETEQVEYLKPIFDEDLAILGSWLGTSLTCDTFNSQVQRQALDWQKTAQ